MSNVNQVESETDAESSNSDFSVTGLGSCRVIGPLRQAAQSGAFSLNQTGVYGYCHSAPELRQQMEILAEGETLPDYLHPVIAPVSATEQSSKPHDWSDFYVIEICSAKELEIDGFCVQLNYLAQHFEGFFAHRAVAKEFWRLSRPGFAAEKRGFLHKLDQFQELCATDQHLLSALRFSETTPNSLRNDINALREMTPDRMFVTHFNALKHDGSRIRSREAFVKMLVEELRDAKALYFNPSDYIEATGQPKALADSGRSLSHYSAAFEAFLADNWLTRYIEPRRQKQTESDGAAVSKMPQSEDATPNQTYAAVG